MKLNCYLRIANKNNHNVHSNSYVRVENTYMYMPRSFAVDTNVQMAFVAIVRLRGFERGGRLCLPSRVADRWSMGDGWLAMVDGHGAAQSETQVAKHAARGAWLRVGVGGTDSSRR